MAWHGKVRPGLVLFLFSFVVISEATSKNIDFVENEKFKRELYRYETAYACEGKTLKIECKDGELIKLIRANYGRFSITICNDHGNTDWSVNCMSPKSLRVLHSRCTQYQNCSIPASTSMFGDPCPGTHKYLEAHYQCLPATTTTPATRPSPPWLITSQPPMWSTLKPSSRPPQVPKVSATPQSRTVSTTTSSTVGISSTSQLAVPQQPLPSKDEDNEEEKKVEPLHPISDKTTTLVITTMPPKKATFETTEPNFYLISPDVMPPWNKDTPLPQHCSPTTVRSIYWNWTKVNTTNIQPCPGGTTGFAKWHCTEINHVPQWIPQTPDLSECRSVWLTSLEQRIIAGRDPLISITSDLAQVTSSKILYGGDMMITTKIIQKMTQKMSQDIQTFPDTRQREAIVTEMLMDVAKTGSNLLDSSQHPSWRDLSYKEQMSVATSLLIGLEENAFLLADTVMREKTVDREFKNILLSVRVLDTKSVTTEKFPSDSAKTEWIASNDSIELPKGALLENSDGGLVRLVFVAFDRLEEILQWQPDPFDPNLNKNVTRMLNSKVISASLGKGRHIQLREPVRLTFKHLQTENVSNPSCVFWDYTTNAWSEEGCHVELPQSNKTHTICLCDHLTNFAILMDVHAIYLPIQHEIALQVITYIGCIISIICLILAIITFQLFRGLKSDRTTIHCNLCICLLIAECLFLIGIGHTENRIACGVIAGFLQYFFLCAFVWMFFEGFQLYVMLIEVFEAEKSRIRWYYFFAYGLPLIILVVSASIYPQGYGTERHCWLQTDNYFIYSFVGPVILVIILNIIFLTMAIVMMCRHASSSVSMKNKEHSRLSTTSGKEENALQTKFQAHLTWLKGAIVLVFLLGITWTFGFLYLNEESVVMAYIFAALNSLQGFFIFVFHCVQNEKVRKEYRKFIRRHSWLPKCLRCSKPITGGRSSSGSSGAVKERRTSLYGGSNGNPSGTNSHSTDNTVLSPHATSNISFKSYSRDSGHGGSEQEDSPRSHPIMADHRLTNAKELRRQAYMPSAELGMENCAPQNILVDFSLRHDAIPHPKQLQLPQSLQIHGTRKKNGNFKPSGHWGHHTYTEIYDVRLAKGLVPEDDPVYEEIEHNEIQVSDMSDEDGKRQSDMSRQSSRSYGDHRPLIPYSPGADRSILESVSKHNVKDLNRYAAEVEAYRMRPNMYRGDPVHSLAAVLDGETVVCHLEPPEMYPRDPYMSRTLVLPPYSES